MIGRSLRFNVFSCYRRLQVRRIVCHLGLDKLWAAKTRKIGQKVPSYESHQNLSKSLFTISNLLLLSRRDVCGFSKAHAFMQSFHHAYRRHREIPSVVSLIEQTGSSCHAWSVSHMKSRPVLAIQDLRFEEGGKGDKRSDAPLGFIQQRLSDRSSEHAERCRSSC